MKIHDDDKEGTENILSSVIFGDEAISSHWGTTFSLKTSWSIYLPDKTAKKDKNHCSVYQFELWFLSARNTSFFIHSFYAKYHSSLSLCSHFTCWSPNLNISAIIFNDILYFPSYESINYIKTIWIIRLISIFPINTKCHETGTRSIATPVYPRSNTEVSKLQPMGQI